jgi:preprotein translocase subunit SecD
VEKKWRASIFAGALLLVGLLSLVYSTRALADLIFLPTPVEAFQTRIILKPDISSDVGMSELIETREVVAQRLDQLNVPGPYQLLAHNDHLSLTLASTEKTPYIVDLVSHVGQIEFIDGGEKSPPLGRRVQGDGYDVLFTAQDIEVVTPPNTETGQIFYRLSLTPSGSQRMAEFSANQNGHYVCMVIDQQVINCTSMYHVIGNTLDILPSLGSGHMISLNDLAVFVESGPLPITLKVER